MTTTTESLTCKPQETLSYEELESLLHGSGKDRFSKDSSTTDNIVPAKFDVLCGRDHESLSHIGNRRFRAIVAKNREMYQYAKTRDDKYRITDEIIDVIHECGGRFLKKDPETDKWYNVGKHCAHEKVSHALRSARDPKTKCPRKTRTTVHIYTTNEDNPAFEALLTEQQRIFGELLREEEDVVDMGCAEGDHTYDEWRASTVSV
jgi:hypothetical protein